MKKIFILTGEPSGDKLASKVISKLQNNNPEIEYSCVCLLYTSPSPRDGLLSRMPSSA